jgi:hypothetical protein
MKETTTMTATMTDTMMEPPVVDTKTPGELISAKTICLMLKIGRFGNSKKASLGPVTVNADKKLLRLSKQLLESPELVAIEKFDTALKAQVRKLSYTSYFKGGVHLIPILQVPDADAILTGAMPKRQVLVDHAVAMYQTRVAETLESLGDMGNPMDYPSAERFRQKFYLEYSYVTFDTPSRLKAISAEIFQHEKEKAQAKLESVAGECQQAMRAGLLNLLEHLEDRLTPGADGKPKRLHDTTIGHLNDFLATFELRNVTDDTELGAIVEQARNVMKGLDRKVLKSDDLIRIKVVEQLNTVKAALDPLVIDKATRQIDLDDEA